jgi:prepilin-type N-terminal cleavage/methylation domain-containing protein
MLTRRNRTGGMKLRGLSGRHRDDDQQPPACDHGFSLVEVVIAIALMGTVVLALLDATFASVKASTTGRESAEIQTVLQNAADRVNRADPGCDYSIFVKSAVLAKGWQATQASATYQYYQPGIDALATSPGLWFPPVPGPSPIDACGPTGVRSSRLIQLVTIEITDISGHKRTMQVMKSDV